MGFLPPTIVLFDMDGTTVRHVHPRFLSALEYIDDAMFKSTAWLHRSRPHPDYSADLEKKPRLLVHRALHRFRNREVDQIVQPCPGIYTLLDMFHGAGIPMGIVSNGLGKGYGHDILEKFDLAKYFVAQVFREDIKRSKPDPDPLLRALRKIRDPLKESDVVWYIGDRHKDVIAALAANEALNAKVVPFAYGLKAAVAILEKGIGPDHIIMNYTDFATRIYPMIGANERI
jgi:phosphoglycolate phosphatase